METSWARIECLADATNFATSWAGAAWPLFTWVVTSVSGQPPFVGDNPVAVAYQHVHQGPRRASAHRTAITPALDTVLLTALAKDRNNRFQSARSFREALQSAAKSLNLEDDGADTDTSDNVLPLHPPWHTTTTSTVSTASCSGR